MVAYYSQKVFEQFEKVGFALEIKGATAAYNTINIGCASV